MSHRRMVARGVLLLALSIAAAAQIDVVLDVIDGAVDSGEAPQIGDIIPQDFVGDIPLGEDNAAPLPLERFIVRTKTRGPPVSLNGALRVLDQLNDDLYLVQSETLGRVTAAANTIAGAVRAARRFALPAVEALAGQFDLIERDHSVAGQGLPSECVTGVCNQQWGFSFVNATGVWRALAPIGRRAFRGSVVDSGVRHDHVDLRGQINRTNCRSYSAGSPDATGSDDNGHGTHVAGVMAAVHSGGTQVVGINAIADVAVCKFLNASKRGAFSDAIRCMQYLSTVNASWVQNHSWGWAGPTSLSIKDAIKRYICDRGGLLVTSAGNSKMDIRSGTGFWPANFATDPDVAFCILPVAAVDSNGRLADFSNYGPTVPIAAPGVGIVSTYHTSSTATVSMQGTSTAAPHVAGAALLLKNTFPRLSMHTIKVILIETATRRPLPSVSGNTIGGGILNLGAAFARASRM